MKKGKNQRFPLAHTTLQAFSYTLKKSLYARKLYRDFIFKHRILYQKIHTEKNVFMSFPSHRGSLPSKRCVSVSVQQVSWLEITFLFPFPYHLMQYSGSDSDRVNTSFRIYSSYQFQRKSHPSYSSGGCCSISLHSLFNLSRTIR